MSSLYRLIIHGEDSPTYQRDKTTLTKIKTKAALEEEVATEEATDSDGVITF